MHFLSKIYFSRYFIVVRYSALDLGKSKEREKKRSQSFFTYIHIQLIVTLISNKI